MLHLAINNNCPKIVGVLIEAGANPEARDGKGDSPLHYAARIGSIESLAALLDSGATVDLPGHGGRTALFEAIRWNELEAVELLLDRGANVHYQISLAEDWSDTKKPLYGAADNIPRSIAVRSVTTIFSLRTPNFANIDIILSDLLSAKS